MGLKLWPPSPRTLACAAIVLALVLPVWSVEEARTDALASAPKLFTLHTAVTVNADHTAEVLETRRITILKQDAIRAAGQQVATYIEGMESLDLVEAYTQKSDGRRLDVSPDRIFRRDAAIDGDGNYLVDQKALTAFFPDLSVGDTVVFTTRLKILSGSFPGHLVTQFLHSSAVKGDKANLKITIAEGEREIPAPGSRYRIVVPRDMDLTIGVGGEGVTTDVTQDETSTVYIVTFGIVPEPEKGDPRPPVERGPHILLSTLRDYADLGINYWAAAEPHVAVTPVVQAMADEITAGIDDRREQAKAISDWVRRNIRYLIVHKGIGRDLSAESAETVLRNRYGECKEHAVLTKALLAAKGIDAELVLINLGKVSLMPDTPTLAFFNHLMIYLPEFELYDDPTAPKGVFGQMSFGGHNKPVVHLSERGARIATTPAK